MMQRPVDRKPRPLVASAQGPLSRWAFKSARLVLPVSPNLERRCEEAGLEASAIRLTPNGVDTNRFRPPTADESAACVEFLSEQGTRYGVMANDPRVWADLAHTLFNAKDFIYLN